MPDFWNPASWTFSLLHRDGSISDFYALPCWACNFVYSYKAMSSRMFLTSPVVGLPQFTHCSSLSSRWQFSSQQSLLGESFHAKSFLIPLPPFPMSFRHLGWAVGPRTFSQSALKSRFLFQFGFVARWPRPSPVSHGLAEPPA